MTLLSFIKISEEQAGKWILVQYPNEEVQNCGEADPEDIGDQQIPGNFGHFIKLPNSQRYGNPENHYPYQAKKRIFQTKKEKTPRHV